MGINDSIWLQKQFNLDLPIIMAPMFLVTNEKMLEEADKNKIIGCIPALNYRNTDLFEQGLKRLKVKNVRFGVNIIVNPSNPVYKKQTDLCVQYEVDFIITSLGGPQYVIDRCKDKKTLVLCDVVNLEHAQKVEQLGADAIIAVNSGAGGHRGNIPMTVLIPLLKKHCKIPIISAGGVGTGAGILSAIQLGADGLSIGSPFISCHESDVSKEYKEACVQFGGEDIVATSKLSGTPCTVINTDYVKKIGTEQNWIEKTLNKNRKLKKYAKGLTFLKGMKAMEKAAFSATYKTLWCAGSSIEFTQEELSIAHLLNNYRSEYQEALAMTCGANS
jgi:nitronate monooxygenase